MIKKNITVARTARYFVSAGITEHTTHLWFVCHGYAQLADSFLENFAVLDPVKHVVIAPEGLNRFYWKGFSDKVVASWMTKVDREDDIADYVNYLDKVYDQVIPGNEKLKVNVLGFSQGTATVCRWIANGHVRPDHLILWAGSIPPDVDLSGRKDIFERVDTKVILGNADEFISEQEAAKHLALLDSAGIHYELVRFEGKHEIKKETLLQLAERL